MRSSPGARGRVLHQHLRLAIHACGVTLSVGCMGSTPSVRGTSLLTRSDSTQKVLLMVGGTTTTRSCPASRTAKTARIRFMSIELPSRTTRTSSPVGRWRGPAHPRELHPTSSRRCEGGVRLRPVTAAGTCQYNRCSANAGCFPPSRGRRPRRKQHAHRAAAQKESGDHAGERSGEHEQRHVDIPPEHARRIVQPSRNLKRNVGHRRVAVR